MSFDTPSPQPMMPMAPPPPPMLQDPKGKKPKKKPMTPTFLGADVTPTPSQVGQKTLIGQ